MCFKIPYLYNLFTLLLSQLPFNLGLAVFMKITLSIPVAQNTRTNRAVPHTYFRKGTLLQKFSGIVYSLKGWLNFSRKELLLMMMMVF